MLQRQAGTIINVAGMLGFAGPAPLPPMRGRAIYTATLAHLIAFTQAMHEELSPGGLTLQVCCPGVVATEFHTRQGIDMSAVPRMSAQDVVTASLRGLELGEVLCAPGVEDTSLLGTRHPTSTNHAPTRGRQFESWRGGRQTRTAANRHLRHQEPPRHPLAQQPTEGARPKNNSLGSGGGAATDSQSTWALSPPPAHHALRSTARSW
jgi:hypothetical protein